LLIVGVCVKGGVVVGVVDVIEGLAVVAGIVGVGAVVVVAMAGVVVVPVEGVKDTPVIAGIIGVVLLESLVLA
jgi:hypothetical protein